MAARQVTQQEGVRVERVLAPALSITEFTDPGCPWAWSAEPARRRLDWLYGDSLDWRLRMVVLSESPEEYEERGFTPELMAAGSAEIAREHRMPIDTAVRERMAATRPACVAVVAARIHAPRRERRLLRELRIRNFRGEFLDDPAMIARAGAAAGLDAEELAEWMRDPRVLEEIEEDMRLAREPNEAARALEHKLAEWSGGTRYTCPSYVFSRTSDGATAAVPGFQPFAAYEVVAANLTPDLERRPPPESVEEVLSWADEPLATQEVAAVCEIPFEEARQELGRIAVEEHLGSDGLWSLPG